MQGRRFLTPAFDLVVHFCFSVQCARVESANFERWGRAASGAGSPGGRAELCVLFSRPSPRGVSIRRGPRPLGPPPNRTRANARSRARLLAAADGPTSRAVDVAARGRASARGPCDLASRPTQARDVPYVAVAHDMSLARWSWSHSPSLGLVGLYAADDEPRAIGGVLLRLAPAGPAQRLTVTPLRRPSACLGPANPSGVRCLAVLRPVGGQAHCRSTTARHLAERRVSMSILDSRLIIQTRMLEPGWRADGPPLVKCTD